MACPPSRPTPSGGYSTRPATAINARAPGAPPAPPCAAARRERRSSPTPMRRPKKVDRGRLSAGRGDGPVGLVRRPGRAVPDDPLSRAVLAPRGGAGAAAARISPRRHGQGPDPVPPRRRAGADRGGDGVPEHGPAPLAEAGDGRDPRRDARLPGDRRDRTRREATGVGAMAGGPLGQADVTGGVAAAADAPGAG